MASAKTSAKRTATSKAVKPSARPKGYAHPGASSLREQLSDLVKKGGKITSVKLPPKKK